MGGGGGKGAPARRPLLGKPRLWLRDAWSPFAVNTPSSSTLAEPDGWGWGGGGRRGWGGGKEGGGLGGGGGRGVGVELSSFLAAVDWVLG